MAGQIDSELAALLSMRSATTKQQLSASLVQHVAALRQQSIMVVGGRREQLAEKLQQLTQSCEKAESGSSAEARAAAERGQKLWSQAKSLYPTEALQPLPPLWSCAMHPELMKTAAGNCPICGMPLEPIYVTQPELTEGPVIGAEVIANGPLEVGKRADLRIRLFFLDNGQPVGLSDLEETHTRKIHLLISDITETDYHHEHPEPAGDGEYAFSFAPRRPDTYRVWADLLPSRSHVQQYSVADIPSSTPRQARLAEDEAESRHAEIDGYKFDLSFEKDVIHDRDTVAGKLRVTEPDGRPCKKLGVVMGAFGHFVGFGDDFATVLHLHPTGPLITDPEARSGPELSFYFRANKAGFFRLFAQVKIEDRDFFPRFVLHAGPRVPTTLGQLEGRCAWRRNVAVGCEVDDRNRVAGAGQLPQDGEIVHRRMLMAGHEAARTLRSRHGEGPRRHESLRPQAAEPSRSAIDIPASASSTTTSSLVPVPRTHDSHRGVP